MKNLPKINAKKKREEIIKKIEVTPFTKGGMYFIGAQDIDLLNQFEEDPDQVKKFRTKFAKKINEFQEEFLESLDKMIPVVPYECLSMIKYQRKEYLNIQEPESEPEPGPGPEPFVCNIL